MKRGVLQFTACCLAVGMTFTGTGSVAFAAKDTTLAGLGAVSEDSAQETLSIKEQMMLATQGQTEGNASEEAAENTSVETSEGTSQESVQQVEPAAAEEVSADTSMSGEIAFAQCEEYINVRSSADAGSEVVGKVYNNGSVTILSQQGDWYEVQSGNAVGYVKAEYFATGEQAQAIADQVAYNVATVYPEALTVRSEASEDSEPIGMAYSSDELEVVAYEGDWMKVALGGDTYGYVNAYYVDYDTYYPTAETLEEEQARLDAEWTAYLEQQAAEQAAAEQAYLDAIAQQEASYQAELDAAAQAAAAAQAQAEANAAAQAQATAAAQSSVDQAYQAYLDAQATADAATQQADEQLVYDTAAQAQAAYQQYLDAIAAADAQAQAEADAAAQAQAAADQAAADQAAADAAAQQVYEDTSVPVYEDNSYEEPTYEEPVQDTGSSLGSQIVNFATQFVGNPYVWGGTSLTNGADCSGFTQSVFANFGISIPRTAAAQSGSGTPVDLSEIQAGDLLFYYGDSGIGHVTMYMGNGQVVHASTSSTGIIISDYGYRTPCCARRYW